jgi:heme-degrading monooxygenase HmoA
MFVTLIRADELPGGGKDDVVQALNEMAADLDGKDVRGFRQAYLLRGEKGNAIALAMWDSPQDAEEFMRSEHGQKAAKRQDKAFGGRARKERYQVTWRAKFSDRGGVEPETP